MKSDILSIVTHVNIVILIIVAKIIFIFPLLLETQFKRPADTKTSKKTVSSQGSPAGTILTDIVRVNWNALYFSHCTVLLIKNV